MLEDDSPLEAASTPNTPRNLAAWKISIPFVDFTDDSALERKERMPVFCIDVERNDRMAGGRSEEPRVCLWCFPERPLSLQLSFYLE